MKVSSCSTALFFQAHIIPNKISRKLTEQQIIILGLLYINRTVRWETLRDELWIEPPKQWKTQVRVQVHRLRKKIIKHGLFIRTIYKLGYYLERSHDSEVSRADKASIRPRNGQGRNGRTFRTAGPGRPACATPRQDD